jgi:hypothetical protein
MEANLLGIREVEGMLEIYLKEWNIRKNSLHIITNKKNFSSINRNLISNYLNIKNKIIEIKENKIYHIFISKYFKRKILIKNKITKKEINKIIKEIKKK